MSFGFSFFNNPALFSTTAEAVPELGIEPDDIEIPPVEVPEPEIKPDPVLLATILFSYLPRLLRQ